MSYADAVLRSLRDLIKHARTMRRHSTDAERLLWNRLRHKQLGVRFRRQHPVGRYIVDFYCAPARLVVELDGGGHADPRQVAYDGRRDRFLRERGLDVMRVWNPDVFANLDGVLEVIWGRIHCASSPPTLPSPQGGRVPDVR